MGYCPSAAGQTAGWNVKSVRAGWVAAIRLRRSKSGAGAAPCGTALLTGGGEWVGISRGAGGGERQIAIGIFAKGVPLQSPIRCERGGIHAQQADIDPLCDHLVIELVERVGGRRVGRGQPARLYLVGDVHEVLGFIEGIILVDQPVGVFQKGIGDGLVGGGERTFFNEALHIREMLPIELSTRGVVVGLGDLDVPAEQVSDPQFRPRQAGC